MYKFLSKYALAAHLALLVVAPLFMFPFFGARETSVVVLWLSCLCAFWLFLEPSRRYGELLHHARKRTYESIKSDPLFWAFFLLAAFAAVRCLNGVVSLGYDFVAEVWHVSSSGIEWLPSCTNGEALPIFATLSALMVSVIAARHALGASARAMLLFLSSLFAGIAFLVAFFAYRFGFASGDAASLLKYESASFAGTAFGIFFLAGIVSFAGMLKYQWNKSLLVFSFATGASFAGLLFFAPLSVVLFYSVAGLLVFAATFIFVAVAFGIVPALKVFVGFIIAAVVSVAVVAFAPIHDLSAIREFIAGNFALFPENYFALKASLADISMAAWERSMWLGSGIGAFPLIVQLGEMESNWVSHSFNAWLALLVERGIIGTVLFFIPACFMAFTFVSRIFSAALRKVFWPIAVFGPFVALISAVLGFFDSSVLRCEVMVSTSVFFAIAASSFPKGKSADQNNAVV